MIFETNEGKMLPLIQKFIFGFEGMNYKKFTAMNLL